MTPTESALWQSIEADPSDRLRRGALSDYYRENSRYDEADAVQATAGKWPKEHRYQGDDFRRSVFSLAFHMNGQPTKHSVPIEVWVKLRGNRVSAHQSWKDYPTFLAAMLDLVRAWCVVHREGVTIS